MTADPGWRAIGRHLPFTLLPHLAAWASKRRKLDGLTSLRMIYVSFPVTLLLLLAVLQSLDLGGDGFNVGLAAMIVLGFGVLTLAGRAAIQRQARPDVSTSELAAIHYRTWTFLSLAFANAVALIGFVFVFLTESVVPYYVGLAAAAPGLYLAAPSSVSLGRAQQALDDGIDLISGLVTLAPAGMRLFGR